MGGVTGDAAELAFREVVVSSSPALLRAAWLLTGDQSLAQDLVQAAFERVWTRWDRVSGTEAQLAYVRKVMTSIFLTWRRRRWWSEIPSAAPWGADRDVADADDVVDRRCVADALSRLTRRQRVVVVLRYFADLSEAQTADVLGCSVGTVKVHGSRALRQLRVAPELAGVWQQEGVPDGPG